MSDSRLYSLSAAVRILVGRLPHLELGGCLSAFLGVDLVMSVFVLGRNMSVYFWVDRIMEVLAGVDDMICLPLSLGHSYVICVVSESRICNDLDVKRS